MEYKCLHNNSTTTENNSTKLALGTLSLKLTKPHKARKIPANHFIHFCMGIFLFEGAPRDNFFLITVKGSNDLKSLYCDE